MGKLNEQPQESEKQCRVRQKVEAVAYISRKSDLFLFTAVRYARIMQQGTGFSATTLLRRLPYFYCFLVAVVDLQSHNGSYEPSPRRKLSIN